jgi:hypothetical protein
MILLMDENLQTLYLACQSGICTFKLWGM